MSRSCGAALAAWESGQCEAEDVLLQFITGNTDCGGDGSWLLTVLPDGAEYLGEQLEDYRGIPSGSERLYPSRDSWTQIAR